jgi:hypothetical protein
MKSRRTKRPEEWRSIGYPFIVLFSRSSSRWTALKARWLGEPFLKIHKRGSIHSFPYAIRYWNCMTALSELAYGLYQGHKLPQGTHVTLVLVLRAVAINTTLPPLYFITLSIWRIVYTGTRGSVVGWVAMLQTGRTRVPFAMRSLKFSIDIKHPAALWPWGGLSL